MIFHGKFTSNLKRAGAGIEDSLELLRHWTDEIPELELKKKIIAENVLGKKSFRRRSDFLEFIFLPRFIRSYPTGHWKLLQLLDKAGLPANSLKQLLYFYIALNEPFIPFLISHYLLPRYIDGYYEFTSESVCTMFREAIEHGEINVKWTPTVLNGVISGLLNICSEFGLIKGKARKIISPELIHLPVFVYVAFFIYHQEGISGEKLLKHDYWKLFLLNDVEIKHMLYEAHQRKYLWFEEVGHIYKVSFYESSFEDAINALIQRSA